MGSEKRQRQKEGRQARLEAEQAVARRGQRRRRLVTGGLVGLIVVAAVLLVAQLGGDEEGDETATTTSSSTSPTAPGESTTTTASDPSAAFEYGPGPCPPAEKPAEPVRTFDAAPMRCTQDGVDYGAVVTTSEGTFTIDLSEDTAPGTVNNFVVLARYGYFDSDDFHRIVPDFVVQGGDPVGEPPGTGGPGYTIPDELPDSVDAYTPGSVAMANSGPDTNGSQWFVYLGPNPLPGPDFSLFGQVTEGDEVVKAIEGVEADPNGMPAEPVTIESVEITEG